jgi:hypothetical protein
MVSGPLSVVRRRLGLILSSAREPGAAERPAARDRRGDTTLPATDNTQRTTDDGRQTTDN